MLGTDGEDVRNRKEKESQRGRERSREKEVYVERERAREGRRRNRLYLSIFGQASPTKVNGSRSISSFLDERLVKLPAWA
jgi:hypothetical protein